MIPAIIGDRFAVMLSEPARRGGTAVVYKAVDTHDNNGRFVAVKVFDGVRVADDLLHEFFLRESEALTRLKHPAIVEIIASGKDEASGRYFVALEWLDSTLESHVRRHPAQDWEAFAEETLLPLLEGLAFAHGRHVLHRDIKPSNILVGMGASPRLADFGLAKIIDSLREGQTVQDFRSVPFAPPEHGRESTSARGDLFSLGITALTCLVPPEFRVGHTNIDDAIAAVNLPATAAAFLRSLTALDPAARPFNAEVALTEYRALQRSRPRDHAGSPRVHLRIPRSVEEKAAAVLGIAAGGSVRRVIVDDLNRRAAMQYREAQGKSGKGEAYSLLGDELSYLVAPAAEAQERLCILNVHTLPTSLLESRRETHLVLDAQFTFDDPLRPAEAKNLLVGLLEAAVNFGDELRVSARRREEAEVLRRWRDILRAKEEAELQTAEALEYASFALEGTNIRFKLTQAAKEDEIGKQRLAYTLDRGRQRKAVAGVVEDAVGEELVLHVLRGDPKRLPPRGLLLADFSPANVALRRQHRALDAVQYGRALRPDLKDLLLDPSRAGWPVAGSVPALFQPNLDPPKQEALRVALNAPDLAAVQGPPGAGKTTWIAELVAQFLRQGRGRVLLSGQTHIAVDNALERIQALSAGPTKVLRVGPAEKIGEQSGNYRLDLQMAVWAGEVRQRSETWLNAWAAARGVSPELTALGARFQALEVAARAEAEQRQALESLRSEQEELTEKQKAARALAEDVFAHALNLEEVVEKAGAATIISASQPLIEAARIFIEAGARLAHGLQTVPQIETGLADLRLRVGEAEEVAGATGHARAELQRQIAEGLGNAELARAPLTVLRAIADPKIEAATQQGRVLADLQSLQAEWFQRFGAGEGFREALLTTADVVAGTCIGVAGENLDELEFDLVIIDEASKATPTEALTAMVRGKQWVLVGDQKQLPPFADESLDRDGLLDRFGLRAEHLRETLFDRLIAGLPAVCRPALTTQHRMHPTIGHLISECFYQGELSSARENPPHPAVGQVLPRPVTWFSTSQLRNRGEQLGRGAGDGQNSYVNAEEATRIRQWLERLDRVVPPTSAENKPLRVGVISGYAAQKAHLMREIVPGNRSKWRGLDIEINSVDAFQGREVDVLVYSVTRSNNRKDLGFVRLPHRLNVALSRGRDALVVFGDAEHCQRCTQSENAFPQVLEHIKAHPAECALEVLR